MRYTRYDYKKYGRFKFFITVIIIVVISIATGLYVGNFLFRGNKSGLSINNDNSVNKNANTSIEDEKILALQCGYYSKKENADALISQLSSYCQPFIVEESGNYRVIAGIYNEELGMKKFDEFSSKGIDVAKISIDIKGDTLDNKKIIEIVDGFLKITSKFEESDVKSIKTSEFKEWAQKVINDGNSVKSGKINEIDNYVKSLPDELDKNNSALSEELLFTIIKND